MRQTNGIFINEKGEPFRESNLRFTTKNPHFMAGLKKDPPHVDILTLNNATALSITPPQTEVIETVIAVPHHLSYTPEVLTYYYVEDSPDPGAIGYYYANWFPILAGGGFFADYLYTEVDGTNLYIKHVVQLYWSGAPTQTSNADQWTFRVKYYILSSDSGVDSYTYLP